MATMPSKKRKYNARFPAGRIKKIMQTDEEVGKVAQAVPVIISRTLELFVESLLSKAMQVTMSRNAKTLTPSHVKQCILSESRFDFLRDLVKNIPDVSAAEEKEMLLTSAESSPNSSRYPETPAPPRKIVREDSNSSSSSEIRLTQPLTLAAPREPPKRGMSIDTDVSKKCPKVETETAYLDAVMDLSKKAEEPKPVLAMNFYQETLPDEPQQRSVITVNPTYSSPQPSTSNSSELMQRLKMHVTKRESKKLSIDVGQNSPCTLTPPVTPVFKIDFTPGSAQPVIKVLDTAVPKAVPKFDVKNPKLQRQSSKTKMDTKKMEKPPAVVVPKPVDLDHFNSENLQIDEDYDT